MSKSFALFCKPCSIRLLSAEERRRAERFRFDRHRARWIQARAHSRRVLGGYLAMAGSRSHLYMSSNILAEFLWREIEKSRDNSAESKEPRA